jgi:hypothetical protein
VLIKKSSHQITTHPCFWTFTHHLFLTITHKKGRCPISPKAPRSTPCQRCQPETTQRFISPRLAVPKKTLVQEIPQVVYQVYQVSRNHGFIRFKIPQLVQKLKNHSRILMGNRSEHSHHIFRGKPAFLFPWSIFGSPQKM